MTKKLITGLEIRQMILAYGLRPSKFDEQGLFDWCQANDIGNEDITLDMIERYRLLKD